MLHAADSIRPFSHYRDNHVPVTPSDSLQYACIGVPTSALTFKARYNHVKAHFTASNMHHDHTHTGTGPCDALTWVSGDAVPSNQQMGFYSME